MRMATMALLGVVTFSASTALATAGPMIPASATPRASKVIPVAGGCGRGFHRFRGVCVPNRRYRPYAYYPRYYGYYPYYRDGYAPWNHPTPGDYGAANWLNAQQAGRGYWGYPRF
jgi:hypothetical protein